MSASPPRAQPASPSPAAPAVEPDYDDLEKIVTLEHVDGFAAARNMLRHIAEKGGEWCGIPMPIEGTRLIVDPSYPYAQLVSRMGEAKEASAADKETKDFLAHAVVRNRFWSWHWRCDILVYEIDGKIKWGKVPRGNNVVLQMDTLAAADAWGIEQERNAIDTLGKLLRHRQFKQYLLTGMFVEKSERSGVHYIFRRLRPTIAFSMATGEGRMLCALCMHPIGYYQGSWAGAMCPTDDVIAHLMLMRGDEPLFWRKANQHPTFLPEAGL